jgi:hypothetical protein
MGVRMYTLYSLVPRGTIWCFSMTEFSIISNQNIFQKSAKVVKFSSAPVSTYFEHPNTIVYCGLDQEL